MEGAAPRVDVGMRRGRVEAVPAVRQRQMGQLVARRGGGRDAAARELLLLLVGTVAAGVELSVSAAVRLSVGRRAAAARRVVCVGEKRRVCAAGGQQGAARRRHGGFGALFAAAAGPDLTLVFAAGGRG